MAGAHSQASGCQRALNAVSLALPYTVQAAYLLGSGKLPSPAALLGRHPTALASPIAPVSIATWALSPWEPLLGPLPGLWPCHTVPSFSLSPWSFQSWGFHFTRGCTSTKWPLVTSHGAKAQLLATHPHAFKTSATWNSSAFTLFGSNTKTALGLSAPQGNNSQKILPQWCSSLLHHSWWILLTFIDDIF